MEQVTNRDVITKLILPILATIIGLYLWTKFVKPYAEK
jgi:hypothetical protein